MELTRKKKRLGDMLIEEGLITQEQLEKALPIQKSAGKKLGEVLVDLGFTTEDLIVDMLCRQFNMERISLSGLTIPDDILNLVNGTILRKHSMMPFEYNPDNPNVIRVAMADPMDILAIDDFFIITNLQVEAYVGTPQDIMLALDKYYGDSETLSAVEQYTKERESKHIETEEEELYNEDINNSPIVLLVKTMIEQAARQRASDIHIEALPNKVRVRYRIDGALYEKFTYNIDLLPAIIARLKIIGGMDISEKRKPQDGRISMLVDRLEFDIRVSILPTVFGEKCVMRLAQKKNLMRDKRDLGFSEEEMKKFDHILSNPHGIILVTGPTGSGKSTTLYTALSELNKEDVNIITVEDPVEANIDGINQVQVNNKADLTFASALRSILRQDPDIIMIGEIRDRETASIAVQASITGHLVVSTLHTNSAANTISRLIDMGVESYLIADSAKGVIAQRLVRRLCPHCKTKKLAEPEEIKLIDSNMNPNEPVIIYEPVGCPMCNNIGYMGRIGVYEIMEITPKLKSLISKGADAEELKEQALKEEMKTLHMSAAKLVLSGTISISEMIHVSFES
ncbi:GspE/PulE family protein [Anaerosacchariphilus polymeriproducens]|uniref:Type II secretion system protein GspE n=1 Tax=Anaerosacchariphilus polymeriproducens TaxID=1812858 RepID=A0A371AQK0_9FIRM|nr:ATPase, T2SS/T4P/T4SS family [Anaerosacchariphilus polymeriproducens]RDU21853.1 type II secretion system protein GspE [Anaerosacchariphilus polymeriproducens]